MLQITDTKLPGKVICHKRDHNGNMTGRLSTNTLLDTTLYGVEFTYGHFEAYVANLIAEHIYEQLDNEGNTYWILDQIIENRRDNTAVSTADAFLAVNG